MPCDSWIPQDINKGLIFDGRFAEDFKLASGTFVNVGPLRSKIMHWFAPYMIDAVITGHDRNSWACWWCRISRRAAALAPACRRGFAGGDSAARVSRAEIHGAPRIFRRAVNRQLEPRRARDTARRTAVARWRRNHGQRLAESARDPRSPRRPRRRNVRSATLSARSPHPRTLTHSL